ncbi:MAG: hypothetical protein ACPGXY_07005 [Alphaproteobacteria bacterium]
MGKFLTVLLCVFLIHPCVACTGVQDIKKDSDSQVVTYKYCDISFKHPIPDDEERFPAYFNNGDLLRYFGDTKEYAPTTRLPGAVAFINRATETGTYLYPVAGYGFLIHDLIKKGVNCIEYTEHNPIHFKHIQESLPAKKKTHVFGRRISLDELSELSESSYDGIYLGDRIRNQPIKVIEGIIQQCFSLLKAGGILVMDAWSPKQARMNKKGLCNKGKSMMDIYLANSRKSWPGAFVIPEISQIIGKFHDKHMLIVEPDTLKERMKEFGFTVESCEYAEGTDFDESRKGKGDDRNKERVVGIFKKP